MKAVITHNSDWYYLNLFDARGVFVGFITYGTFAQAIQGALDYGVPSDHIILPEENN